MTAYTYQIGTGSYELSVPTFRTSPFTCAETVAYTMAKQNGDASPSYMTFNADTRVIKIQTADIANVATVLMRITITRQYGTTGTLNWTLTMNDPCATTTLTTQSIPAVTVKIGSSATGTFTEVRDSAGTTYSLNSLCGVRNYAVFNGANAVNWITFASATDTVTMTVTPTTADDSLYQANAYSMTLRVTLATYNSKTIDITFSVTVQYADCSCAGVIYTANTEPSTPTDVNVGATLNVTLQSAVKTDSTDGTTSSVPAVRSCYRNSDNTTHCGSTGNVISYTALADSTSQNISFITFTAGATGNQIVIAPTSANIGTYRLRLTQTNTKGTPSIVVNALQLRVNCIITTVANLVAPAEADRTINLFLGPKEIDFSLSALNPAT